MNTPKTPATPAPWHEPTGVVVMPTTRAQCSQAINSTSLSCYDNHRVMTTPLLPNHQFTLPFSQTLAMPMSNVMHFMNAKGADCIIWDCTQAWCMVFVFRQLWPVGFCQKPECGVSGRVHSDVHDPACGRTGQGMCG